MSGKEELSWMDMLRQPAPPGPPKASGNAKISSPSSKEPTSVSSNGQSVSKSVSTPSFSGVRPEAVPPVSLSQKPATAVEHISSARTASPGTTSSQSPAAKPSAPSSSAAGAGLTWADALQITAQKPSGNTLTSSPAATSSAAPPTNPSASTAAAAANANGATPVDWMEFLSTTNENASMNWMEALRRPMPAPATPADSQKVNQYLKTTIVKSKEAKKEAGDLGTYFGMDSKRKADDDSSESQEDGGIALVKKKSDSRVETRPPSRTKPPLPEPQELREEGAILVLENNTYVVRAATPEKLVETLTSEARSDLPFTNTFMLTFRAFMTPIQLYNLLMKRFNLPPPATTHPSELEHWRARVSTPTRLRVFIVMKMWVTFHWMDFERDSELLALMRDFPRKLREVGMQGPADMFAKLLEKKVCWLNDSFPSDFDNPKMQPVIGPTWGGGNEMSPQPGTPAPKPLLSLASWPARPEFLKLPPEELARQLTLIEHDLFRVIPPWELLGMGWMKSDKTLRAPNIIANISRFNYVSQWVTSEVILAGSLKDCQACIEHMIRLMEECYALQNYCSTLEIISGLEQTPVWRLKEVWSNVNPKLRKSLEEKAKKFRSDKNWKKHRKLVQTAIPPCIPYLGMYLTDLVFADEINKEREGYVNFDKYRVLARIIHELQLHQRTQYNLEPLPFLRNWWTSLRLIDENTAYERSYALIPRGGTQRAEKRGSNSLAIRKQTPPKAPAMTVRVPSEQSPYVTFTQLRNSFPFMVKETILALFPPEKFTFSSWRAMDTHGVVYGWSDEVEIYLAQNDTDTIVIHAAMNATKSDIFAVEHQVRLYDISAGDKRFIHASIIALVTTPDVTQVAEEKGIEMIMIEEMSLPDGLEPLPSMFLDTLSRTSETVVSPRGGFSTLQQFFGTVNCGEDAVNYMRIFQRECIIPEDLPYLTMDVLTELGVKMGHAMKMMKIVNQLARD